MRYNYSSDIKENAQYANEYQNAQGHDRNSKENGGYNYQNQGQNQNQASNQNQKKAPPNAEKKLGFYNFPKTYQTEAIIEAPDEGDY